MVDPTATLTLSVSSSLTDTLTALRHSILQCELEGKLLKTEEEKTCNGANAWKQNKANPIFANST